MTARHEPGRVHALHNALYGPDAVGRSETLEEVWAGCLAEVEWLAEQARSLQIDDNPQAMQVSITTVEAMFVREAISAALKARPDLFDAQQIDALILVEHRLCHAIDRKLAERRSGVRPPPEQGSPG